MKNILKSFFSNLAQQFEGENFGSVVVADEEGTELFYEGDGELEAGLALYVLDAEGMQMPAPEGEHTLEDGRVITVDANGVVSAVVETEMGDDEKEEEEMAAKEDDEKEEEEMAAKEDDEKEEEEMAAEETEDFSKELEQVLEGFKKSQKTNKELSEKLKTAFEKIEALEKEVERLGAEPSLEPEKREFNHVERADVNPVQRLLLNKNK